MKAEDLRHQFHNEEGISWENSQGEPDIDYVMWLERKVLRCEVAEATKEMYPEAFILWMHLQDYWQFDITTDMWLPDEPRAFQEGITTDELFEYWKQNIQGK